MTLPHKEYFVLYFVVDSTMLLAIFILSFFSEERKKMPTCEHCSWFGGHAADCVKMAKPTVNNAARTPMLLSDVYDA